MLVSIPILLVNSHNTSDSIFTCRVHSVHFRKLIKRIGQTTRKGKGCAFLEQQFTNKTSLYSALGIWFVVLITLHLVCGVLVVAPSSTDVRIIDSDTRYHLYTSVLELVIVLQKARQMVLKTVTIKEIRDRLGRVRIKRYTRVGGRDRGIRAGTDLHHFTSERFHYVSKTGLHHLHW